MSGSDNIGDAVGRDPDAREAADIEPGETVGWVSHPARRRPLAAALVTLFVAGLAAAIQLRFEDGFLTALAVTFLAVSLAPFYLPTRYRMTEDTVSVRTVFGSRRKPWDLYRRYQADRHGALLSPFDRPSRLDRFHGLNLRFDEPDRDRVIAYLQRRFPGHDREV